MSPAERPTTTATARGTSSTAPAGIPGADRPSTRAEQRARTRNFWRHHPLAFAVLIVLIAFTSYERVNDNAPAWYLELASIVMIGFGIYMVSPAGARRQAEYERSGDRAYRWMPMPKSPGGIRVIGIIFILVGALAALTTAFGV